MSFTAQDVKSLREKTNAGMMDCKKALTESGGNFEKAIEYLREKGLAAAAKKATRVAAEGVVSCYVSKDGIGSVVEVNSETDFVGKNEDFQKFVSELAETITIVKPNNVEDLLNSKYLGDGNTVSSVLNDKVLTIGENIQIRRFELFSASTVNVPYIHMGGSIGVMIGMEVSDNIKDKPEISILGKDIGMQAAAMFPTYLDRSDVSGDALEKEREILLSQAKNENAESANPKPDSVIEKMVEGRIKKFYEENCLLQQMFVKDNKISIASHVENIAKSLGGTIKVTKFVRFEKGEGIEKQEASDFAAEVANMAGK